MAEVSFTSLLEGYREEVGGPFLRNNERRSMENDSLPPPRLPLSRYRLWFVASAEAPVLSFTGSTWRGAFGTALKQAVCVTHEPECPRCILYRSCTYPYLFETPPPPNTEKMRRYNAAPRPFLLDPRGVELKFRGRRGNSGLYRLDLTLFGYANRELPFVIHALEQAGRRGLGRRRWPMELEQVEQETATGTDQWHTIYGSGQPLAAKAASASDPPEPPRQITICLETPLRTKREEQLVGPEEFKVPDLFGPLLRRISMLTYFHTETPLETDFKKLMTQARRYEQGQERLYWHDWSRYSNSQRKTLRMGGLLGEVTLDLASLGDLWPYLWLGQWTHVGKGTVMGLGRYRIVHGQR